MSVRVGVAGLRRGQGELAVLAAHPLAEVVAVADLDPALAAQAAARYGVPRHVAGFDELLTLDLEAVVVATPPALHAAQSIAALEAGRHVLCEVPAVWTVDEARELVAAVERSAASYMFAENVCYYPRSVAWERFIAAGRIGRVIYAEAEYVHDCRSIMRGPDGTPTWRASMPPLHYCTHSLGPLLQWTGDRCVSVSGLHTGCNVAPELGAIDLEVALLRCASGAVFKLLCGFSVAAEPGRHWYAVYGTEGMLESGRTHDSPDRGYLAGDAATRGPAPDVVPPDDRPVPAEAPSGGHGTAEWFMVDAWLRALESGATPPIDVYAGLDMTLPGIVAHLSAEAGGAPLDVPDPRGWRA